MKKFIASVAVLLTLTIYLVSCEKDDICSEDTPTTPNVIIEFYDRDIQDQLKSLAGMQYYEVGNDNIDTLNGSRLELPLRTDADTVKWAFKYTATIGGETYTNIDILEFRYTRNEVYVSRACGYKTLFLLDQGDSLEPNPLHTDDVSADGLWIYGITTLTNTIENEDETHVKIFF